MAWYDSFPASNAKSDNVFMFFCFVFAQAFWFTEQRGSEGPVFGSNDQWRGLGVFFDSFDNDGQVRKK